MEGASQEYYEKKPSSSTRTDASELAAITMSTKIPEFWTDMPRLWFAQVESILAPQKQGDEARFNVVVAKMGRDALQQVSDLLINPPKSNKYETIKERLLKVYEESAERQFQKLVGEMELGSQKPSQLLRRMRELGRNAKASEETLHSLWIARLPTSVRTVLTVSQDQTLENLANIADKVMENIRGGEVATISTCTCATQGNANSSSQVPVSEILTAMHKLNVEVASLRDEVNRHRRSPYRGRGRGYGRASSRHRSKSRTPGDPDWLCKFHYWYRNRARTCEKPCAWKTPENKDGYSQ